MTLFQAFGQFAGAGGGAPISVNEFEIMTPTSVTITGTSGSINANGGVDFNAATGIQINGVFDADHTNYFIMARMAHSTNTFGRLQFSTSGTPVTTGYDLQSLLFNNTSVTGERLNDEPAGFWVYDNGGVSLAFTHILNPFAVQRTSLRSYTYGTSSGHGYWAGAAGDTVQSFDGFYAYPSAGNLTGNIAVYGYKGAV